MRRATTPTIRIYIDKNIKGCWYRVTFAQRCGPKLIKDQNDCTLSEDGKTILVPLTQDETLLFNAHERVKVQVKFGSNDKVAASSIVALQVKEILDEAVM